MTAGRALGEGGVSAAVEKEDRLLAAFQARGDRLPQPFGEDARSASRRGVLRVLSRALAGVGAQVDEFHRRESVARHPFLEFEQVITPGPRILPALEGRRRGAEHAQPPFQPRAHDRDGTGVVTRHIGLLVAALVLLVDDDRAQIPDRREHRRARADRDPLPPLAQAAPGVEAFPVREPGVQHGDLVAEAGAEALHGLGRESDLRDEEDAGAAQRELTLQHFQVDGGLARARHAAQERDAPRRIEALEIFHDLGLVRRQGEPGFRFHRSGERIPLYLALHKLREAPLHEPVEHAPAEAELLQQVPDACLPADRLERLVQLALPLRPPEGAVAFAQRSQFAHKPQHALGARPCGAPSAGPGPERTRGEGRSQNNAERRHVVVRDPPAEIEERRVDHGGFVEDAPQLPQSGFPFPIRPQPEAIHDSDRRPAVERHANPHARFHGADERGGDRVGERTEERPRDRHLANAGGACLPRRLHAAAFA